MSKRTNQAVPTAETGALRGDGVGKKVITLPKGVSRNPNVGTSGRGQIAPKPSGGANLLGNDRPSAPTQASMARVPGAGNAPSAGSFLPVQKPKAGLQNQRVGQTSALPPGSGTSIRPITKTPTASNALATNKPKRRGIGASFYGEY